MTETPLDYARIAAQIATNERTRSELIKSMPGYRADRYQEFAAIYKEIETAIGGSKGAVMVDTKEAL